jgi:exoribonuclease-2
MKTWYYDKTWRTSPYMRSQAARLFTERRGGEAKDGVGHVVEFVKGGQHRCGVVLSQRRSYLCVFDQDGKETLAHHDKIVDVSFQILNPWQPREETIGNLREIAQARDKLKESLDVRTLWELVAQSEHREWSLGELVELCYGNDPGSDGRCALSRALDGGHLFERRGQKFIPLDPEAVAQNDEAEAKAEREEEWFHEAGEWLRELADGKPCSAPRDAERAFRLLAGEAIFGAENPDAHEAAKLMKLAHLHGPQAAFGALVKAGHWDEDENLDILRYDVPVSFSDEAIAEAEACSWTPEALKARGLWFARVYGLSRDGGECDRAISIRRRLFGYKVGVHFCSPALMVRPDSVLQAEAAERGTSLRLPDRIVRMLPAAATSKLRLSTEERRPTLTVEIRLNSCLEVQGTSIRLQRVRLTHALSFDEADARFSADKRLGRLREIARRFRKKRQESGAVIIPEPEIELAVKDRKAELRPVAPGSPSGLVSDELRIFANSMMGEFCAARQVPAIHRAELPASKNVVKSDDYDPVACYEQKRLMPKARLQVAPGPHHGLGVDRCVPVDKPLHRFTDLLMHQQLVHVLTHAAPLYTADDLEQAILQTAWARETGNKIEASARHYWLLKWLERLVGEDAEAVVLERRRDGLLVELRDCLLRAFVPADREARFAPGDNVTVAVGHVSARGDEIQLGHPRKQGVPPAAKPA